MHHCVTFLVAMCLFAIASCFDTRFHTIKVIDEQTERGIPMVNLTTVNMVNFYTDSNGVVAFYELGLMNTSVYFTVLSDGYFFQKDEYGYSGVAVQTTSGARTVLKMKRRQVAQRVYRSSGEGIYRDSLLAGEPILNGRIATEFALSKYVVNKQVMGLDSVMLCMHKSTLYSFYGDTLRISHPLGNFHATGAVLDRGMNIEYGLNLTYLVNSPSDPFVKSVAPVEPLSYPTWIHDIVSLPDLSGNYYMLATYYKPYGELSPETRVDRGLLLWNENLQLFEKKQSIEAYTEDNVWPVDGGHPLFVDEYVYFGQPYPMVRCKATVESYFDLKNYEAFTCLKEGTTIPKGDLTQVKLDRDPSGNLVYNWKKNTSPLSTQQMLDMVMRGMIKESEAYFLQLQSIDDPTEKVVVTAGSVQFNTYRNKYIMIAEQYGGKSSLLGEIWYSEATAPHGPWQYAKKIATHNSRDLYNPLHFHYFDAENGKIIYFEGTYANTFDIGQPTPRYIYNQQMFKVDLSDLSSQFEGRFTS